MMKRYITIGTVVILTLVFVGAYASSKKESSAPAKEVSSGAAQNSGADSALSGKVVETMSAGGYTYACLEKNGKKTWVAVPQTEVVVGRQISFEPGQEMKGFTSKTLNRTFDSIYFSGGVAKRDAGEKNKPENAKHGGSKAAAPTTTEKINVEKAAGPDAYTVGEIYEKRAKLNTKNAVVRGKVVKVSAGIMGKNWIHLQDGTGDAAGSNNDLIATSQDLPKVGDVVTMKGKVYQDKDFGAGYKYAVIMEQASIQK